MPIHYPTPPIKTSDRIAIADCEQCHKPFEYIIKNGKARFCSKVCHGHYMMATYPTMRQTFRQTELSCSQCGETFFRPQSQIKRVKHGKFYCSPACKVEGMKKKSPVMSDMKHGTVRRELLKLFDGSCQECGYSKRPDLLRVWFKNHSHEVIRPDNVLLLCPNCFTEHQLPVTLSQRNRPLSKENRGKKGFRALKQPKDRSKVEI